MGSEGDPRGVAEQVIAAHACIAHVCARFDYTSTTLMVRHKQRATSAIAVDSLVFAEARPPDPVCDVVRSERAYGVCVCDGTRALLESLGRRARY